jgi:hypothetical protein
MTFALEPVVLEGGDVQVTISTPSTVTRLDDVAPSELRKWAIALMRAADAASVARL